ncbi:hypothetical protein IPH92_01025 [Candidatus Kaiserbacteria bacterium]|nr:MAG: hypothetical protein IPH92_01025 [Candidatus Kaiserbacteria bacterium]
MQSTFHNSTFPKDLVKEVSKKAHAYRLKIEKVQESGIFERSESSLCIAGDGAYQKDIKKRLAPFTGTKHVILVAIGGSMQGVQAVYDACVSKEIPRLSIVDSIEEKYIEDMRRIISVTKDARDIVLVVVSKSGTTTETMLNALHIIGLWEKKFGEAFLKQIIFIGNEGTPFLEAGAKKNILSFTLPHSIGGRFSVFSAVGVVPLTLLGINIPQLLKGALDAVKSEALTHVEESAVTLALHAYSGVHTVNFFSFNRRLRSCGLWYRQLLAESTGKSTTKAGTPFMHQLLPIVSTSADLHSSAELYLGGYTGIYTHFVYYTERTSARMPQVHWLLEHLPFLKNRKSSVIKDIITEGVLHAYNDQMLPYRYTKLEKCTEYEVGFLLASLMAEVMYIGYLFNIDTFDQPSVEFYKKYVRAELS